MRDRAHDAVAIVGIGCRFPGGVDSPAAFWQLLVEGREAIGPMPPGRMDLGRLVDPTRHTPGRVATAEGGFLEDVDGFDAAFFGIAAREARKIDPQHRLLMEVVWEALEDCGIVPAALAGSRTGVYVGLWSGEYEHLLARRLEDVDLYSTTGSGRYAASGRISFALDLRGPALTVDTACSSSLVAVHLARQALLAGEVELAVVGAANVILQPFISVGYSISGMLSPGARCRFGAAGADGYVRSEGAAAVVLKRLADALRDRDPIHAVILGSAVNSDGRSSGTLAAPGAEGQEAMLREAYTSAALSPADVRYVEAHGTGTTVGDGVELAALGRVLGAARRDGPLPTGSVKRLIGHTEAVAGLAGLVKAALSLEHGFVPAGKLDPERNPAIPWEELNVEVAAGPVPLDDASRPALVGVSSFGITGTNAHVVLGRAPQRAATSDTGKRAVDGVGWGVHAAVPRVVAVSARTPAALREGVARLAAHLATHDDVPLADLSYTTTCRRVHHEYRVAVVAASVAEARAALDAYVADGVASNVAAGVADPESPPRLGFVFSGQGSQWAGMARELARVAPTFADALRACEAALAPHVDWSLSDAIEHGEPALERVDVIQPVLGAVQIALARQLDAWGVRPAAVVGHSMGEVAAACVAGALPLEDAMHVLALRSRLLAEIAGRGAMALVDLPEAEVRESLRALGGRVQIAAVNGPRSTVVAGDPDAVSTLLARLEAEEVFCRRVKVDVASHSAQTDPLLPRLGAGLAGIRPVAPRVPFYSTVFAEPIGDRPLDGAYWARNLRRPVRLAEAVARMLEDGVDAFVEISPHPILLASVKDVAAATGQRPATIPLLVRGEPEPLRFLAAVAALHALGAPVAWEALAAPGARVVRLPTYPWQRERFRLEERDGAASPGATSGAPAAESAPPRPAAADTSVWEVAWELADVAEIAAPALPGRWLILADEGGVAERFARLVDAAGGSAALLPFDPSFLPGPDEAGEARASRALARAIAAVASGEGATSGAPRADGATAGTAAGAGAVSDGAPANGTAPLGAAADDGRPAVIANLWPLDARSDGGAASLEAALERACGTALVLLRALDEGEPWSGPVWWVTRGAQAVGGRAVVPEATPQAALWGFVRSAAPDRPALDAHIVDLDPASSPDDAARELFTAVASLPAEHQVAFDAGTPHVARLAAAGPEAARTPAAWRRDVAYLITGGLGGIGLEVARTMVRAGAARLVLAARTPLPPRREWRSPDLPPAVRARIEAVRELERLGASVHLIAVDVADEAALAAALRDFDAEGWPPIRGIVHCAGVVEPGHSCAALRRMARGKVLGAWNLYRLLPDVEHVVLCSSFVSAIPEPGQAAYAAANAALDGLASAWRARGARAVSLSWGIWRETGMMREEVTARYRSILAQNGVGDMDPAEAAALFHWLGASPRHHLVVAHVDLAAAGRRLQDRRGAEYYGRVLAAGAAEDGARALRDELLSLPHDAALKRLTAVVRELAGRVMGVAPSAVVATQPLGRQGIDSLMALELRNRLEIELGLVLPASVVWNYPTPVRLAAHLAERLRDGADGAAPDGAGDSAAARSRDAAGPPDAAGTAVDGAADRAPAARSSARPADTANERTAGTPGTEPDDGGADEALAVAERVLAEAGALSDEDALRLLRREVAR